MKLWKYEEVETREDIQRDMPDDWKVKVYKVTSGDSGKTYYVQHVFGKNMLAEHLANRATVQHVFFCNCPEGIFRAPLSMLSIQPCCKHAINLIAFLKEKKRI